MECGHGVGGGLECGHGAVCPGHEPRPPHVEVVWD